jgi:hypothetical protein
MEKGELLKCCVKIVTAGVTPEKAVTCGVTPEKAVTCCGTDVTCGGLEAAAAWTAPGHAGPAGAGGGMDVVAAWKAALPGGTAGAGEGEGATEHGGAADTRGCRTERPSTSPKGKGGAEPQRSPPLSIARSSSSARGRSASTSAKIGAAMLPAGETRDWPWGWSRWRRCNRKLT